MEKAQVVEGDMAEEEWVEGAKDRLLEDASGDIAGENGILTENLVRASSSGTGRASGKATAQGIGQTSANASSEVISGRDRLAAKRRQLLEILRAKREVGDTERELSVALKKELNAQEIFFENTVMTVNVANKYTLVNIERWMPTAEDISKKDATTLVKTIVDGRVVSSGPVNARVAYAQFIRWILWEKGFHGEDKNISFDTYQIDDGFGTHVFREGPLVNLTAYLKAIIRKKLQKENKTSKGGILLETERALELIGQWWLENLQGTDYGVGLLALYVGLPARDRNDYIEVWDKEHQMPLLVEETPATGTARGKSEASAIGAVTIGKAAGNQMRAARLKEAHHEALLRRAIVVFSLCQEMILQRLIGQIEEKHLIALLIDEYTEDWDEWEKKIIGWGFESVLKASSQEEANEVIKDVDIDKIGLVIDNTGNKLPIDIDGLKAFVIPLSLDMSVEDEIELLKNA